MGDQCVPQISKTKKIIKKIIKELRMYVIMGTYGCEKNPESATTESSYLTWLLENESLVFIKNKNKKIKKIKNKKNPS